MIGRAISIALILTGSVATAQQSIELSRGDLADRLRTAAAAISSNTERLRSWEGAYSLLDRQVVQSLPIGEETALPGPFFQEYRVNVKFELDLIANKLRTDYRVMETPKFTYLDGAPLKKSLGFRPPHFLSIATPEHFLYTQPDTPLGEIDGVELSETLKKGRTIERSVASEAVSKKQYSFVIDPRDFFINATPDGMSYAKLFMEIAELAASATDEFPVRGFVERAGDDELLVFEIRTTGALALTTTEKFSRAVGYNLTDSENRLDGSHVIERKQTTYHEMSGVFVPDTFQVEKYDVQSGEMQLHRDFEWVSGRINGVLDEELFTIEGLQPQRGDRYVDHIEQRVLAVDKDHHLVRLDEFGSADSHHTRNNRRYFLLAAPIVLLVAVIAVYLGTRSSPTIDAHRQ